MALFCHQRVANRLEIRRPSRVPRADAKVLPGLPEAKVRGRIVPATAWLVNMADGAHRCLRVVVGSAEGTQRKPLQEETLARVAVVAQPIVGLDCLNDPPAAAARPC